MTHHFTHNSQHLNPRPDPDFVFEFTAYEDLADGQRWSTWLDVEPPPW